MRLRVGLLLVLLAQAEHCSEGDPAPPRPDPKPGDAVLIRGALSEDVDCRILRADGGKLYSLSVKLPNLRNGSRICVRGTIAEVSQCLHQPSIEVDEVKAYGSCP
jgi:hypothetical protein